MSSASEYRKSTRAARGLALHIHQHADVRVRQHVLQAIQDRRLAGAPLAVQHDDVVLIRAEEMLLNVLKHILAAHKQMIGFQRHAGDVRNGEDAHERARCLLRADEFDHVREFHRAIFVDGVVVLNAPVQTAPDRASAAQWSLPHRAPLSPSEYRSSAARPPSRDNPRRPSRSGARSRRC